MTKVPGTRPGNALGVALGVFTFAAPIAFGPKLFSYHPHSLYDRHMQAASEYQMMQKQVHGLRVIILSQEDGNVMPVLMYAWLNMFVSVKKHVDLIEKPWNCDYKSMQEERMKEKQ